MKLYSYKYSDGEFKEDKFNVIYIDNTDIYFFKTNNENNSYFYLGELNSIIKFHFPKTKLFLSPVRLNYKELFKLVKLFKVS